MQRQGIHFRTVLSRHSIEALSHVFAKREIFKMALPPPPAPPPPPPPPPIGEAIPPYYPGPAPSMQPVTTAQPAPDAQTASQPNTTPGNEDKIWERSWTVDELRKGSSNWTLAADSGVRLSYFNDSV